MERRITRDLAKKVLSVVPPDFTREEWEGVKLQALLFGRFRMADTTYIIVEPQACNCPVDNNPCEFGETETGLTCHLICGVAISETATTHRVAVGIL